MSCSIHWCYIQMFSGYLVFHPGNRSPHSLPSFTKRTSRHVMGLHCTPVIQKLPSQSFPPLRKQCPIFLARLTIQFVLLPPLGYIVLIFCRFSKHVLPPSIVTEIYQALMYMFIIQE